MACHTNSFQIFDHPVHCFSATMQGHTDNSKILPGYFHANLDKLFDKRVSERVRALTFNIQAFTTNQQNPWFMKDNLITLLDRCLISIKKGSDDEIFLAANAIGLMAVAAADKAHELYVESLPVLSKALEFGSPCSKILESMVLLTFFGATNCEETENSMQLIWEFIHKISVSTDNANEYSLSILPAAISAWAFLLASMNGRRLSYKYWKGVISYFFHLLEDMDEALGLAVCEALTLILETGSLEKFSDQCSNVKKDEIIERVKKFIHKFREQDHDQNQDYNEELDFIYDVINVFENDDFPQASVNIGGHLLTLSTYSQITQLNYLKQFLGRGFKIHMMENKWIQDVFDFTPKIHVHDEKIWEEATVTFFVPEARTKKTRQRLFMSPNSAYNKARTLLLNKNRDLTKRGSISE